MCSRYADTQCCVCCRFLDKSQNRIIVEICGHQKCRECFIKEEDGCSICSQNKQENAQNIKNGPDISRAISTNGDDTQKRNDDAENATDVSMVDEIDEVAAHIITTKDSENAVRYKCTICQKTFKSRNNRRYHLFCDKTRSKPLQCNQCDKQFITLAHLNYHQSTHDTDKEFSCPNCHKVYSGDIALKKHMKKHQSKLDWLVF